MLNALVRALVLCLAIVGQLAVASASAGAAEPTTVTAAAEPDGDLLVVSGQVTSRGKGVKNADVGIAVGAVSSAARTDNDGLFITALPLPDPTLSHRIQVTFGGRGNLAPASVELVLPGTPADLSPEAVPMAAKAAPPPQAATAGKPAATASPEPMADSRAASAIEATASRTSLEPGEVLTLTGSLTADGAPLPASEVQVWLGGQEHTDSLTFTGDDGSFSTFLEVPLEQSPGETEAVVRFPGGDSHLGSESTVTLTIEAPAPEPTAEPEPSVSEAPTTQASAEVATAVGEAGDEPADSDQVQEDSDAGTPADQPSAPMAWFWLAAVVVGGSAILVTIALLMRRNTARGEQRDVEDGVGPLTFLDDDPDDLGDGDGWDDNDPTEEFFTDQGDWDADDTATAGPAETVSGRTASAGPTLSIYRDGPPPVEHQPRRSWSGED
ncbi:hypothetical protein LKO27_12520 [Tessaracoccus sp. OS52]|uniref:hypothetical protein n=1 Tax=Tessaracoccus sp. OS52 TaxID=2886691 RepID=UPI001D10A241|nr:hypothetical protein [Tessaracoccus sp. OS52]MCC2594231.1 hypothetical protein [Tessaracoccus sp. OS52]